MWSEYARSGFKKRLKTNIFFSSFYFEKRYEEEIKKKKVNVLGQKTRKKQTCKEMGRQSQSFGVEGWKSMQQTNEHHL